MGIINTGATRRSLLLGGLTGAAMLLLPPGLRAAEIDTGDLKPMTDGIVPIGAGERQERLARARALMAANRIDAVLIEPGSSLVYFTGLSWWRSERLTAALLPLQGDPIIVTPFFEEPSIRETLAVPAEVHVWQEDENPHAALAAAMRKRGLGRATVGIEETARWFASEGLKSALPDVRLVSANPVVRGCRMRKTAAEIALMQRASDIILAAMRWTHGRVRGGETQGELASMIAAAAAKLGGKDAGGLVLIGESSAYPHGSDRPQRVADGRVVLFDWGCSVEGYRSDISRTFVFGKAPDEVRRVWDTVAEGQQVAMRAARIGAACGSVDDAVRAFYAGRGFGPGYKLPGTPHRTGHGIGMDGHEPVNLVHGEMTRLAEGMCFSNEPGIYLPGKFGARLEDCFHMTAEGPAWFTVPPKSLDAPFS